MIRNLDIWRCANELIKQYGDLADIEAAIRLSSQSRSPASAKGRPPTFSAAALPVARNRCDHFTTLARLTPKVEPTARHH